MNATSRGGSGARVLVFRGFGFNCEEETAAAYRLVGASPEVVHVGDWFDGRAELRGFDVLHLPGGFSFGDALGAGKVFANRLRHGRFSSGKRVWDEVERFVGDRAKRVLGVCNGFQVLVRAGLLPNVGGTFAQEVSLAPNASGHFVDRWVRCETAGALRASLGARHLELPVRHGEGRLVVRDAEIQRALEARGLVVLRYANEQGEPTGAYPDNPNGSTGACAALQSADGRVLGLMPHPEAYLTPFNHPAWSSRARLTVGAARAVGAVGASAGPPPRDEPDGLAFFRAFVA